MTICGHHDQRWWSQVAGHNMTGIQERLKGCQERMAGSREDCTVMEGLLTCAARHYRTCYIALYVNCLFYKQYKKKIA